MIDSIRKRETISYALIGFDYCDGFHSETVIACSKDALAYFALFMHDAGERSYPDARVIRPSSKSEFDAMCHSHNGWLLNIDD
jgi:hypothetical protein